VLFSSDGYEPLTVQAAVPEDLSGYKLRAVMRSLTEPAEAPVEGPREVEKNRPSGAVEIEVAGAEGVGPGWRMRGWQVMAYVLGLPLLLGVALLLWWQTRADGARRLQQVYEMMGMGKAPGAAAGTRYHGLSTATHRTTGSDLL
jgi:hypothetical protein